MENVNHQEESNEKDCFSNFKFDDQVLISDKFYRHQKMKHDKYSSRAKTQSFFKSIDQTSKALGEMKEMLVQNIPSKMLDRQRKSIYRR